MKLSVEEAVTLGTIEESNVEKAARNSYFPNNSSIRMLRLFHRTSMSGRRLAPVSLIAICYIIAFDIKALVIFYVLGPLLQNDIQ